MTGAPTGAEPRELRWLEDDSLEVEAAAVPPPARSHAASIDERVLFVVVRDGPVSVPEIARALETSESTALRALRRLVRSKKVARVGEARATYRPRR
ncbi:MAG: winged helix-turn-helix domain-containing protein [Polyangiaceae bacterium]